MPVLSKASPAEMKHWGQPAFGAVARTSAAQAALSMYRVISAWLGRHLGRCATTALAVLVASFSITPIAQAAVLSFLQELPRGTHWQLWDSRNNALRTLLVGKTRPRLIFWQAGEPLVYFVQGSGVYRISLAEKTPSAVFMGVLPDHAGAVEALWVDKLTHRLRVAAMQRVRDADVRVLVGKTFFHTMDGERLPASDLPAWGRPYVASVWEMSDKAGASGTWELIARRATKNDAGDTPGWRVLDDFRIELGHSNETLLRSYTCDQGHCRNEVPSTLVRLASSLTGRSMSAEDLSLWPVNAGGRAVLFGTQMGDELHIVAPVVLVDRHGKGGPLLPMGEREQLGLGVQGDLLLVADEWRGSRPVVFDLRSGAVRLQPNDATDAVWVPGLQ